VSRCLPGYVERCIIFDSSHRSLYRLDSFQNYQLISFFSPQRPPRRLRHVAGVIGRDLEIPSDSAAFFSICAPIGEQWKLLYCSEPIKETSLPEWAPLPSTLKSNSSVEIFIAVHVVSLAEISSSSHSSENYKKGVVEALRKNRAFLPSEAEEQVVENGEMVPAAVETTTSEAITTVDSDNRERLKSTLIRYLESRIPGNVSSAYFVNFNELFSLGQHLAGGADAGLVSASFFSQNAAASGTGISGMSTLNINFVANTLIFDFFDGEYGAFPWPSQHEDRRAFSTAANSTVPSIAPSKEPSPFPSPSKIAPTAATLEQLQPRDEDKLDSVKPQPQEETNNEDTATATAAASLGLGSMLMSKLRGSAPSINGAEESKGSGTATPTTTTTNSLGVGGVGSSSVGTAKILPVDQLRNQIEDLVTLQTRIQHLSIRCKDSQSRIDTLLEQQAPARQQHAELQSYQDEKIELARKHSIISQRGVDASKHAVLAEKSVTVTSQALISTLQALQSAQKRISAGETALKGEEGRGRLAVALRELIARRCLMTVQLGWILRLGPAAIKMPVTPPGGLLDAQLEKQWAGASSVSGGGGGGDVSGSVSNSEHLQEEIRLAICGIDLDSSVWAHAFDPGGYDWDPNQDKAASVALGYSALFIDKLAQYLGIVLRYPIVYRGSVSVVMDNHPQAGTWRPEEGGAGNGAGSGSSSSVAANFLFGRAPVPVAASGSSRGGTSNIGGGGASAGVSASPAVAVTPVEYPLYCLSNKERPKFAVGVFLLNKNAIQLLQAHGISAAGPSQLLQNLHKLVAAAQSAEITQGLGSGG
jgi:hypothetical protein